MNEIKEMNRKHKTKIPLVSVVLPVGLSTIAVKYWSWWSILGLIVILVLFVRLVPIFHHRENLWMFFLVVLASALPNIHLLQAYCVYYEEIFSEPIVMIAHLPFIYVTLLSIEEIVIGTVTRFLFRKQYSMNSKEK